MISGIMTPKKVVSYLKMSVLTVYKYAKQGTIPGHDGIEQEG